ncbi:hypothetical protein HYH03_004943 [Edaphochlamys debaryana]|uniref:Uncharacterized protein n=1 Tax=Edaphochlamys debaryana TaxID=47281 RepID=A0A835Y5X4_9CHLO|nr:hypothetical protein HYH03_004943 [Edaphochlamys debaryana]|eukprot:KAG2496937.1 hypothetical protein HYH03_004943 [Edaphochlamys debaryana]
MLLFLAATPDQEPTVLTLWFSRSWPVLDCAYVMLFPTSAAWELLYGAVSLATSIALAVYMRTAHPHLPYGWIAQLATCVVCAAFSTLLQLSNDRSHVARARARAAGAMSTTETAAAAGLAGGSGAAEATLGPPKGTHDGARGHVAMPMGSSASKCGPAVEASGSTPACVADVSGAGPATLAARGAPILPAPAGSGAGAPPQPSPAPTSSQAAAAEPTSAQAPAVSPAVASSGAHRSGQAAQLAGPGARLLPGAVVFPPSAMDPASRAWVEALHHELASALSADARVKSHAGKPPGTAPKLGAPAGADSGHGSGSGSGFVASAGSGFASGSSASAAPAAQPDPGVPRPYKPRVRLWRTHIKINGVEPEDVTPGYKDRIAGVLASAGMQLEGVSMRRGCIELVIDARIMDWEEAENEAVGEAEAGAGAPQDAHWGDGSGPLEAAGPDTVSLGTGYWVEAGTEDEGSEAHGSQGSAPSSGPLALHLRSPGPTRFGRGGVEPSASLATGTSTGVLAGPSPSRVVVLDVWEAAAAAAAANARAANSGSLFGTISVASASNASQSGAHGGCGGGGACFLSSSSLAAAAAGTAAVAVAPAAVDDGADVMSAASGVMSSYMDDLDIGALILALQLPDPDGDGSNTSLCSVRPRSATAAAAASAAAAAPPELQAEAEDLGAAQLGSGPQGSSVGAMGGSLRSSMERSVGSGSAPAPPSMPTAPPAPAPAAAPVAAPAATPAAAPVQTVAPQPRLVGVYPRLIAQTPLPQPRPAPPQPAAAPEDDVSDAPRRRDSTAAATGAATAAAAAAAAAPAVARGPFRLQVVVWWPDEVPNAPEPAGALPNSAAGAGGSSSALPPAPPPAPDGAATPAAAATAAAAASSRPSDHLELLLRCRGVLLPAQVVAVAPLQVAKLPQAPSSTHPRPSAAATSAAGPAAAAGSSSGAGSGSLPGAGAVGAGPSGAAPGAVTTVPAAAPAAAIRGDSVNGGSALCYTIQVPYLPAEPGLLLLEVAGLELLPLALMGSHTDAAEELQDAADCWYGSREELNGLLTDVATFVEELETSLEAGQPLSFSTRSLGTHLLGFAQAQGWEALCELLEGALHGFPSALPHGPRFGVGAAPPVFSNPVITGPGLPILEPRSLPAAPPPSQPPAPQPQPQPPAQVRDPTPARGTYGASAATGSGGGSGTVGSAVTAATAELERQLGHVRSRIFGQGPADVPRSTSLGFASLQSQPGLVAAANIVDATRLASAAGPSTSAEVRAAGQGGVPLPPAAAPAEAALGGGLWGPELAGWGAAGLAAGVGARGAPDEEAWRTLQAWLKLTVLLAAMVAAAVLWGDASCPSRVAAALALVTAVLAAPVMQWVTGTWRAPGSQPRAPEMAQAAPGGDHDKVA